jgi:uncharacterized membrane protein YphA (DoxX/SURF4 family)
VSAVLDDTQSSDSPTLGTSGRVFGRNWLRGAAVVRILFGVLWSIDATFKWQPGFIGGQTLGDELGNAKKVSTPVVHQWLELWSTAGLANPAAFAVMIAVLETLAAVAIIFGILSNAAFIGTAVLSFGIWSGAEGFHLPWHQGMTDLGPSAGYIFASLALFFAAAGSTWSVDTWLRPRLGPLAWLAAPEVRQA